MSASNKSGHDCVGNCSKLLAIQFCQSLHKIAICSTHYSTLRHGVQYNTANFYAMKTMVTENCGVPAAKTCTIYGKGL